MKYVLSELPPIDSVEVVRLSGVLRRRRSRRVDGEAAQEIAHLWRQLPPGKQARCHIPPFALRFFQEEEEVLYSSICWKCNNIRILQNGVHAGAEFDASAEVAQCLLRLIETIANNS